MKISLPLLKTFLLGASCLLAAPVFAAAAAPYPNTSAMGVGHAESTAWYAGCLKVKDAAPPPADLPAPSAVAALQQCQATDLYYDTKSMSSAKPADWRPVRHCAMVTHNSAVLMMLYQNGQGVQKDPQLALKYACSIDAAPAEMQGRIEHLQQINASGRGMIDLCDDITSGYMMGVCSAIDARQKQRLRTQATGKASDAMPAAAQASLQKLQAAVSKFADARAANETDLSGTARAALSIAARTAELDLLARDVREYEGGKLPPALSKAQLAALDKELNAIYGKLMKKPAEPYAGAVGKDGIRATQRLWLAYRDAWISFGAVRYPSVTSDTWAGLLTARRNAQLQDLLGN
ncbi:lysozyme inhibitor LprI family protein [Janthinobacterium violaceinigrum]|uniref:lysozyme inhibitor LprI family protein n=1 Tax=Janthinobacterium violaceinigrum TaxID=2654252 RepID=UPI001D006200|nr:lysozyme inhibitor LprI family protein [Janthinobacterium violaceinigrum]